MEKVLNPPQVFSGNSHCCMLLSILTGNRATLCKYQYIGSAEAADIINTIISVASYVPKNMNENGNLDEQLLTLIHG